MNKFRHDMAALAFCIEHKSDPGIIEIYPVIQNVGTDNFPGAGVIYSEVNCYSFYSRWITERPSPIPPLGGTLSRRGGMQVGFGIPKNYSVTSKTKYSYKEQIPIGPNTIIKPGQVYKGSYGLIIPYWNKGKNISGNVFVESVDISIDMWTLQDEYVGNNRILIPFNISVDHIILHNKEFLCFGDRAIYDNPTLDPYFDKNPFLVPSLALYIWSQHSPIPQIAPISAVMPYINYCHGGDLGAKSGVGFNWWMIKDDPAANTNTWANMLPPGLICGLKHHPNQDRIPGLTLFGNDAYTDSNDFFEFSREHGGDMSGGAGEGFYWYETNNNNFNNWIDAQSKLPKGTILGLKHNDNQPRKRVKWDNIYYDPADLNQPPPPGFKRIHGGDEGASSGHGFYWYEKINGPELFVNL